MVTVQSLSLQIMLELVKQKGKEILFIFKSSRYNMQHKTTGLYWYQKNPSINSCLGKQRVFLSYHWWFWFFFSIIPFPCWQSIILFCFFGIVCIMDEILQRGIHCIQQLLREFCDAIKWNMWWWFSDRFWVLFLLSPFIF